MNTTASLFFKSVLEILKKNRNDEDSVNNLAKSMNIRILEFNYVTINFAFVFDKLAYQCTLNKRKNVFELKSFGITKY